MNFSQIELLSDHSNTDHHHPSTLTTLRQRDEHNNVGMRHQAHPPKLYVLFQNIYIYILLTTKRKNPGPRQSFRRQGQQLKRAPWQPHDKHRGPSTRTGWAVVPQKKYVFFSKNNNNNPRRGFPLLFFISQRRGGAVPPHLLLFLFRNDEEGFPSSFFVSKC